MSVIKCLFQQETEPVQEAQALTDYGTKKT